MVPSTKKARRWLWLIVIGVVVTIGLAGMAVQQKTSSEFVKYYPLIELCSDSAKTQVLAKLRPVQGKNHPLYTTMGVRYSKVAPSSWYWYDSFSLTIPKETALFHLEYIQRPWGGHVIIYGGESELAKLWNEEFRVQLRLKNLSPRIFNKDLSEKP